MSTTLEDFGGSAGASAVTGVKSKSKTTTRPTKWLFRFLLTGALAASFLSIALYAFDDDKSDPIRKTSSN
jgi:hypothetical protein